MSSSTFVYFIATEDRAKIKIGCSHTPSHRLANLAAWSPVPLTILAAVEGNFDDERALHSRYLALHSHREWFNSSAEMLADIAAIAHLKELPLSFKGKKGEPNTLPRNNSFRDAPGWREKVSETHKKWWAREKRERALVRTIKEYLGDVGIDVAELNSRLGNKLVKQRMDKSIYVYGSDTEIAALEKFISESQSSDRQAA